MATIYMNDMAALRKVSGFTLLEVLIALLVLSIGLLGLAALQTFSLRLNHQAYERTQATLLMDEIVDRIRANPEGKNAGAFDNVGTGWSGSYPNCATTNCTTGSALANYDIAMWRSAIAAPGVLASGVGTITRQAPNSPFFNITVSWREHDLPMSQTITVQP